LIDPSQNLLNLKHPINISLAFQNRVSIFPMSKTKKPKKNSSEIKHHKPKGPIFFAFIRVWVLKGRNTIIYPINAFILEHPLVCQVVSKGKNLIDS